MSKPLTGKVALVTGASRGIGRSVAEALARDGATVAVHYGKSKKAADEAVAAINGAGGSAFAIGAELNETGSVDRLFDTLDAELTKRTGSTDLDIVVNNAGIAPFVGLADTTEQILDEIYAVNVKAPFLIAQKAASRIRKGGRIINFSSVVSRLPASSAIAYSVLKAPIDTFTRALAQEFGPREITVNAVAPGVIDTDMAAPFVGNEDGRNFALSMQALKRIGKTDDVAAVVSFLASPASQWITGQVIEVSGGTRITV